MDNKPWEALVHNHRKPVHVNMSIPRLIETAIHKGEGSLSSAGALRVSTGKYTGRSPNDKFIVDTPSVHDNIWWDNNKSVTPEVFDRLLGRVQAYLQDREVFVQDLWAGADPEYRIPVRIVTQHAWHSLFAQNMFLRPPHEARAHMEPA